MVSFCATAEDGRLILARRGFDVLILADRLPDADGFEFCGFGRAGFSMPIIMIASGKAIGRILALGFGADDCLSRPATYGEMLARIRAVLRWYRPAASHGNGSLDFGRSRIEPVSKPVLVDGIARYPTIDQFALRLALTRNGGKVVGRDTLFALMFAAGRRTAVSPLRSIDVHVCRLRAIVEVDPSHPRQLLTVRGVGYRLTGGDEAP